MTENKKASIILVLKVLEEYSDEEHFLTQQDIIDKIYEIYGIELERKSIAFSISLLQELDYDINKSPRGGYALFSRTLDNSELQYVVDSLFSSKSIDAKRAIEISNKLNSCLSKYQRKNYNYIYKSVEINRSNNKDLFYTLELIEEAKRRGKRISFAYLGYDEEGKLSLRKNGYRYIVSPYYTINNNGRYYLISHYRDKFRVVQLYRIDYIVEPRIEEERKIQPLREFEGFENFNITKYINENIYILDGEVIDAEVTYKEPEQTIKLVDWFGKNAQISKKDGEFRAKIRCNERALFYWYMQYSECFTVISPQELIDKIKIEAERIVKKYEG